MNIASPFAGHWLLLVLCLLSAGFVAGFIAGLLGLGGGVVVVPVLFTLFSALGIAADHSAPLAVGTSLAVILPSGILSARAHFQNGNSDAAALRALLPLVMLGSVLGSALAHFLSGRSFAFAFVFMALVSLAQTFSRKNEGTDNGFTLSGLRLRLMGAASIIIGAISTLSGVGGGAMASALLNALGYSVRRSIGIAAGFGPLIAALGTLGMMFNGHGKADLPPFTFGFVHLPSLLCLLPGALLMPRLGARAAQTWPPKLLKALLAAFLTLTAARMLAGAWH